jgi:hypothetical protein
MKLVGRITILAFFAGVPTGWPFVHPTPRRAQSTKSGRTPGGQTWPPVPDSGAWPVFFRSSTHNRYAIVSARAFHCYAAP